MVLAMEELTADEVKAIRQSILDAEGNPLTHEEFARLVGVTVATVSRWENGHYIPSRLARERIRDVAQQYRGQRIRLAVVHGDSPETVVEVLGV